MSTLRKWFILFGWIVGLWPASCGGEEVEPVGISSTPLPAATVMVTVAEVTVTSTRATHGEAKPTVHAPALTTVPLTVFEDPQNGYSLTLPPDWHTKIQQGQFLYAADVTGERGVFLWPVLLEGRYTELKAIDLINFLGGRIVRNYTSLEVGESAVSRDGSKAEVILRFTSGTQRRQAVLTAFSGRGIGLLSGYQAPANTFDQDEPLLRKVLSSYRPLVLESAASPRPELPQLVTWTAPDGSVRIQTPRDWQAQEAQIGTCTVNWIVNDPVLTYAVFQVNEFGIFRSEAEKEKWIESWTTLYPPNHPGRVLAEQQRSWPAYPFTSPDDFFVNVFIPARGGYVTQIEVDEEASQVFREIFTLDLVGDAVVLQAWYVNEYEIPYQGQFAVKVYDFGQSPLWFADIWGIVAPEEEYSTMKPLLSEIFASAHYTDEWRAVCIQASNEIYEMWGEHVSAQQRVTDRLSEKWSDVILSRERIFNPETGEVYTTPLGFYDYYDTHREIFKQRELRPLRPEEYDLVPLDGELHIRLEP